MSHNPSLQIQVPLDIFNHARIQEQLAPYLKAAETKVKTMIFTNVRNIQKYDPNFYADENSVYQRFKKELFKSILADAIEKCCKGEFDYNLISCIESLITQERIDEAINGNCLNDAYFSEAYPSEDN